MNKQEYLDAFDRAMEEMGIQDRAGHRAFMEEMLIDLMENGASEEEALKKLGDPRALAESLGREEGRLDVAPAAARTGEGDPMKDTFAGIRDLIRGIGSSIADMLRGGMSDPAGPMTVTVTEMDCDDLRALNVQWGSGSVLIRAGDGEKLRITEKSREGDKPCKAEKRDGEIDISLCEGEYTGDGKFLTVDLPIRVAEDFLTVRIGAGSADVSVRSLCCAALTVKTGSGDISLTDVTGGKGTLTSGSGDIGGTVKNGEWTVNTASGDVEISFEDARSARISTSSGDVQCAGSLDSVSLSSVSGDVSLQGAYQSIRANTTSGDCEVRLENGPEEMELRAVSGDIDISLPWNFACAWRTRTVSGDVSCPDSIRAGGADVPVYSVQTVSGDICVRA